MDAFINFWGNCLDAIKNIATNISVTFTGADSAAVLVMIIFYLVVAITIVLLLKLLTKMFKTLWLSIFGKKKKAKPQPAPLAPQAPPAPPEPTALSVVEEYNGQGQLDLLAESYNAANKTSGFDVSHSRVACDIPSAPPAYVPAGSPTLTKEQKAEIARIIVGKGRDELRQEVNRENTKLFDINYKINADEKELALCLQQRSQLAAQEQTTAEKYNAAVDEFQALQDNLRAAKAQLSLEYANLVKLISDIMAQKPALVEGVHKMAEDIGGLPAQIEAFTADCSSKLEAINTEMQAKHEAVAALNSSFVNLNDSRVRTDEKIVVLNGELEELAKSKFVCSEAVSAYNEKIEEFNRFEAEKQAKEEAERQERLEAERKAREAEEAARRQAEQEAKEAVRRAQEAERAAMEAAKRAAEATKKTAGTEAASASKGSAFDGLTPEETEAVKKYISATSSGSYSLSFENLSPNTLTQIINMMKRKGLWPAPAAAGASDSADETAPASAGAEPVAQQVQEETPPESDYLAELKKQWAAEKAHKESFQAEQRRKEAEADRRRELLANGADPSKLDTDSEDS